MYTNKNGVMSLGVCQSETGYQELTRERNLKGKASELVGYQEFLMANIDLLVDKLIDKVEEPAEE